MIALVTETKRWSRWATLWLGLGSMLLAQAPALAAYVWWSGRSLTQVSLAAHDGVATVLLICISTPFQVLLLALLAWRVGAKPAGFLGLRLPTKREVAQGIMAVAGRCCGTATCGAPCGRA